MERRCSKDARFGDLYRGFMQEYEDLQHMEIVNTSSEQEDTAKCYLPHHGVLRETSTTTKLRVVFNRSQLSISGASLNVNLLTGANLLPVLADVLLRWRWHRCLCDGHRKDVPPNPHPSGGPRPPADTLAAPSHRQHPRIPPTNGHVWLGVRAISRHTDPTPAR
ncbi:hypothetical protein CAJAP_06951 [Camponotus japonicus]